MATTYKSYWNAAESGVGQAEEIGGTPAGGAVLSGHGFVGKTVKLCEAESRHLVKVFRAREGDAVLLFNGAGDLWRGELCRAEGRSAQVRIMDYEAVTASRPRITLAQALPKGKTMDSVIAAMVELGVVRIAPLATHHSEVRLEKDPSRSESKREHWQQTAIEAAKQSSNFYGTQVLPIASLKVFLDSLPPLGAQDSENAGDASSAVDVSAAGLGSAGQVRSGDLRIIGSLEEGSVPLAALVGEIAAAERVTCLIGPEGDFSPAEYALARQYGFRPVRLAAHVLRVKTAATYIVSTVDALARASR